MSRNKKRIVGAGLCFGTHLDAIVAQYGLAIVQPVDIVHRMARDNALKLCILVHVHGLHLRLQVCGQGSYAGIWERYRYRLADCTHTASQLHSYKPVTVSDTWMVSSPAVLLTQHRYLPLSSRRACNGNAINQWQSQYLLFISSQRDRQRERDRHTLVILSRPADTIVMRSLSCSGSSCSFSSLNQLKRDKDTTSS